MEMRKVYISNTYKILLPLFCIIFNTMVSHSQEMPKEFEEYKSKEIQKIDEQIKNLSDSKSLAFLNLLPNVRYNYNPINKDSYLSVGISLRSFGTYFQNKQRNKIEREKLRNLLRERLDNKLLRLENEYIKILADIELFYLSNSNLRLEEKLYSIKKTQYTNNQINLEEWIKIKMNYHKKQEVFQSKFSDIERRLSSFYKKISSPKKQFSELLKSSKTSIIKE